MRMAFEKKLSNIRLRCGFNLLLEQLGHVLIAAGVSVALAVAVERVLAVEVITTWAMMGLAGVVVVLTGLLWFFRRPSLMRVAILADDRLGFAERFSTALALAETDDPFAKAAVIEAHQAAERANLKGHFPVGPGRNWLAAAAVWVLVAAIFLLMPTVDLLGYLKQHQAEQQKKEQLAKAKVDVKDAVGSVKSAVNQLGDPDLAKQLAGLADVTANAKPEDVRRQAIRKLGDLSDKIKKMQSDKSFESARMMQKMLKRLRGTSEGLMRELNRALANSNFQRASELIKDAQQKLADGKLSAKQKQALAKQLKNLADQLKDLAQQNKQLEDELEKAGADKDLARLNEQDLREALKKAGLSDEQIDKLMEKASACRQARNRTAQLGEAMEGCCGGGQLSGDELAELAEQLDGLDAIQDDMDLTDATLAEIEAAIALLGEGNCEGIGCMGPWAAGAAQNQGQGTGGPGRGYGQRGEDDSGKTSLQKTRVKNKSNKGPIIASWYFKGPQIKGESKRKFSQAVQAGKDQAAEAISENRIPRKYEKSVKKYFGQLDELGKE